MKKFLLLAGGHFVTESKCVTAKSREDKVFVFSEDDLVAIHGPSKFEFVEEVSPEVKEEPKKEVKAK